MTCSPSLRPVVQPHQDEHTHKLQLQSVRRQKTSAQLAIERIRDRHKRQIILGVTLNYKDQHRAETTFEDLKRDRTKLLRSMENDPKLSFIHDALHKAEEGENSGGLHLHVLMFGDGRRRRGNMLCDTVGRHWRDTITDGRGSYHNDNRKAANAKPEALPYGNVTGQIDPRDAAKWDGVKRYVSEYMCKATQPITSRGKHEQAFGVRHFRTDTTKKL